MRSTRKALAVVAGPYRFYQVLWLYTQFPDLEWSILLLPYGKGDKIRKDLREKCEELKIFGNIYDSHMIGQDSDKFYQVMMFLKMLWFYITGRKRKFMKHIIQSQTSGQEFEVFFVGCEYSIIEGAIIGLADEKEVYIFEEGLSDYVKRKKYPSLNMKEIMSFIVTRMGYFSPYYTFEMINSSKCIKYASLPLLLKSREYKEIRQLIDDDNDKFKSLLNSVYKINFHQIKEYDLILLTTVFEGEIEMAEQYLEKVHQWLLENYHDKKILIKKHPRDREEYTWRDLDCHICDSAIPAEILLGVSAQMDVVMMEISTVIIQTLNKGNKLTILRHTKMSDDYEKWMQYIKDILKIPNESIVYL